MNDLSANYKDICERISVLSFQLEGKQGNKQSISNELFKLEKQRQALLKESEDRVSTVATPHNYLQDAAPGCHVALWLKNETDDEPGKNYISRILL